MTDSRFWLTLDMALKPYSEMIAGLTRRGLSSTKISEMLHDGGKAKGFFSRTVCTERDLK